MRLEAFSVRHVSLFVALMAVALFAAAFGSPAWAGDPPPRIVEVLPHTVERGTTHTFVVSGSGFKEGATFRLQTQSQTPTALNPTSTEVVSEAEIRATITIPEDAVGYDAVVRNPDGREAKADFAVGIPGDLRIIPTLDCVDFDRGRSQVTAFFGYVNHEKETTEILVGARNFFHPLPARRTQPIDFDPGVFKRPFSVTFDVTTTPHLTWRLSGRGVRAKNDPALYCEQSADMKVSQSAEDAAVGEEMTYTVSATNDGPLPATNVVLTNDLPADVEFVSATSSKGECSGTETLVCTIGSLSWGESESVEIVVRPERAGTFTNTASVSADQRDRNTANNVSTLRTTVAARSAPSIASVNPGEGVRGGTVPITLSGSGFADGASATLLRGSIRLGVDDVDVKASGDELSGELSIPDGFPLGKYDVEVRNPDGQIGSLTAAFSVAALAPPRIEAVSPESANRGRTVDLIIEGSGFAEDSSVSLSLGNSTIRANEASLDTGKLTARVEIPAGAAPGEYDIEVRNPDGQKDTLEDGFSILALPAPAITGISPSESLRGRSATVSIEGENLRDGANASLAGPVRLRASSASLEPSGSLSATFAIPANMPPGKYAVEVRNPDGQEATLPNAFTVAASTATRTTQNAGVASIQRGRAINRTGRLFAPGQSAANRRVVLFQRVAGTGAFRPVRATTTNANGIYVFRGLRPGRTVFYQVRFAGSDELRASSSPVRRVVVRR